MSERTQKTLTTPNGHIVVMKEYLTAREFMAIMKDVPALPSTSENIEKGFKMIEASVISLDGASEQISEAIQDLQLEDYMFISQEVAKLTNFQKTKN